MSSSNLKLWRNKSLVLKEMLKGLRNYSAKSNLGVELQKLRPLIMKRIEQRAKDLPVNPAIPVAREALRARNALYDGVSALITHIPVWACKYCPEVYIGESGHLIRTCHGYRHHSKNKVHEWVKASINDIIIPVESLHLQKTFRDVTKHREIFDHQRVPAVVELCLQAGVDANDQSVITPPFPDDDLQLIARRTVNAWETLRSQVHKLLMEHPARVCKHCEEVHVGPWGQKARSRGVVKHESCHLWRRAGVEDLVPSNVVWSRRRQDPHVLVDRGREYYGHAPAVVDLCSKAGALVPSKYFCMMKVDGLTSL
ncbi:APO protein 4, mitochondrial-like [Salvia miltiorrhiza]|uniref:APO protein 4, mitochondrial-like n=1 Tax=Salvia miltiorrhiza TaxID=226208 RepID=UPI0025AC816C|nr:APO protein 4, mitochondrial-like [Salvia miltiorrhiza]XP_057767138.1 APO protein 4, mitochondrial-like [Salvia miltiorrhiza]